MSEATKRDLEAAESLTTAWEDAGTGYWDLDERIAAALADERERARAPFLAIADDVDGYLDLGGDDIAARIRAAAQGQT